MRKAEGARADSPPRTPREAAPAEASSRTAGPRTRGRAGRAPGCGLASRLSAQPLRLQRCLAPSVLPTHGRQGHELLPQRLRDPPAPHAAFHAPRGTPRAAGGGHPVTAVVGGGDEVTKPGHHTYFCSRAPWHPHLRVPSWTLPMPSLPAALSAGIPLAQDGREFEFGARVRR